MKDRRSVRETCLSSIYFLFFFLQFCLENGDFKDIWTYSNHTLLFINSLNDASCAYLCFPGPGDVQVSSLTSFGVVSVYVLTSIAEKAVHTDIQASLTLLKQSERTVITKYCWSAAPRAQWGGLTRTPQNNIHAHDTEAHRLLKIRNFAASS